MEEWAMTTVLFLCDDNSCRSRMAQAFVERFGEGMLLASSAGIQPAAEGDAMMRAVMRERGFDIGDVMPAGLESVEGVTFDLLVHFGCAERLPRDKVAAAEIIDWGDMPDPRGRQYADYRKVREEIGRRVMDLIRRFRVSS
jgi:arsenate reductase